MRKNLLFLYFLLISTTLVNAMNCASYGAVSQRNGHYYTTTKDRLSFEYAKTFAQAANGYLAIPDDSSENDFLASLILGNQFAWIGIQDSSLSNEYCYETGSCPYNDSRFKNIKNQVLGYKNWANAQPDNLLKPDDIGQLIEISPLGEHWVAINSVNSKWYDFGNHYDEYNNPAKYLAVYEFDAKPECFKDNNSSELIGFHCNTAISSNGVTSTSGELLQCKTDANGVPYCPANLSACNNVQNTDNGYSVRHSGETTTRTPLTCSSGGTLSGTTCNVPASSYTATSVNSTLYSNGTATSATLYSNGTAGTASTVYSNGTATSATLYSNGTAGTASTVYSNGTATSATLYSNGTATSATLYSNGTATNSTLYSNGTATAVNTCPALTAKASSFWNVGESLYIGTKNFPAGTYVTVPMARCTYGQMMGPSGSMYTLTTSAVVAYNYSCPTGYTRITASGTSSTPPTNNCTKASYTYSCPTGYTAGVTSGTTSTPPTNNCTKASYTYSCPTGYTAGVTSGTASTPPTNNCTKASYTYSCPTGYTAGVTSGTASTPPTNNCSKASYTYSCPTGYTAGVTSGTASTPPTNNCSKASYTYSCPTGYTAGVTSGTASTPPTNNCSKANYNYTCPSGYTAGITSGTSSTPPTNNCSSPTTTYSCLSGGSLSGTTCNVPASSYTATCPSGTNLPSDCSGSYPNTWLKSMYTTLLNRCPDQTGYNFWIGYISANSIASSSQLQPTFCAAASHNNEPCNTTTSSSTTCYGSVPYNYYTYDCNLSTNVYHENYVPQNTGGLSSTSSIPPTNNCVQQDHICGSNPAQTCANINGTWSCSEHPCVDANDLIHTDTAVGSQDGDDNGWNQQTGGCNGQLYIFGGLSNKCRSWTLVDAFDGSDCCNDDDMVLGLISCNSEEKLLSEKRKVGSSHYVGEFCSRRISLLFGGNICVQKSKSYCSFNSKLAKIINEQGRQQLGKSWGTASNPTCKGFTPEEFQKLDLSQIDFGEFINSFELPNVQNLGDSIRNRVTSNLSVSFPQQ
ncbi:MAG: conjugal transfer protein TraN [Sulfurimonas sp.]|jgi:conjugal transfer mating pair stabilization protein TraN